MATLYLDIQPNLLQWALDRADKSVDDLSLSLSDKVGAWLRREKKPTYRQLQDFSKAVNVPFGYLFLKEPPSEPPPSVPDFRTKGSTPNAAYSLELTDSIRVAKMRQDWYREWLTSQDADPLEFVGSATLAHSPKSAAEKMRSLFRFEAKDRFNLTMVSNDDFRKALVERFEEAGILVCIEGYVGSNTRRTLDVEEFRGFVLSDSFAPLIYVNGRDWPAAQLFTLAHECAHLFLGQDAVTDAGPTLSAEAGRYGKTEAWCNKVAAEFLVPLEELPTSLDFQQVHEELGRLRRIFKVSTLVLLQRLFDKGLLNREQRTQLYQQQISRYQAERDAKTSGGSTHATRLKKVGRPFAKAVIGSAGREGTTYTEAFRLLGVKNTKSLDDLKKLLVDV